MAQSSPADLITDIAIIAAVAVGGYFIYKFMLGSSNADMGDTDFGTDANGSTGNSWAYPADPSGA